MKNTIKIIWKQTRSIIHNPIILKSFASQAHLSCFNDVLRTFLLVNKILKKMKMMINCVHIEINYSCLHIELEKIHN